MSLLGALTFVGGCGDDGSTLYVALRTDLVPGAEFSGVVVRVDDQEVESVARLSDDFVGATRVAEFSIGRGSADGVLLLVDAAGVVVERPFSINIEGQTQFATIVISRDCRGVACPGSGSATSTACLAGVCTDPRCSEETPEFCMEVDACRTESDCPAADSCSTALCRSRVCLYVSADTCEADQYCSPENGCQTFGPMPVTDAGLSDANFDTSGDAGTPVDASMDAGTDAGLPLSCGSPCDTGNPCEVGVFDCSTGVPVCTQSGAGNVGVVCREAAGECDLAELCDGTNTECPSDAKQPGGTVCNDARDSCDVAEECDGTTNACPLDAFQPVGTPCPAGFCDETHVCSDTCTPGASCTPDNVCRTGQITCAGGIPNCVEVGNVSDGTECQATEFGAWGQCAMYADTCDESGSQSRSVDTHSCESGACTLSSASEARSCTRDTDGGSCGSVTTGAWSACGGFSGTCDESGIRSRNVTTPTCASSSCDPVATSENGACMRDTDGISCGTVMYGAWSSCGGFSSTCDTTGTQSRSVTTPTCGAATCASTTTSESRPCSRDTEGDTCGSLTNGAWSACAFPAGCTLTGTRSRTVTQPLCAAGSCSDSSTSNEDGVCTRSSSQGVQCGTPTYGAWGLCEHPADCDPAVDATETRTARLLVCNSSNTCIVDNTVDVRVCPLFDSGCDDGEDGGTCDGPFVCIP